MKLHLTDEFKVNSYKFNSDHILEACTSVCRMHKNTQTLSLSNTSSSWFWPGYDKDHEVHESDEVFRHN